MIVRGRVAVIWKARDELYHVVGSEKTRIRKCTRKKRRKKSGFWFTTFPLVSGQTLKQVSHLFTIGQTRVSGFGLKCTGTLESRTCAKMALFYQCLWCVDTGKKRAFIVFWISTSRKFWAKPLNTSFMASNARKPALVCLG